MIRSVIRQVNAKLRLRKDPIAFARSLGVLIGDDCRLIATTPSTFGSEPYLVTLGNHVTVTAGVRFITHDGGVWVFREEDPRIDVIAPIAIGDNVFIGMNAILLPGVTVGDNCVIGAGAVVSRAIPPNSVAIGSPARVVKSLDEYRGGVDEKALYIRTLPADEKRAVLMERFRGATGESGR